MVIPLTNTAVFLDQSRNLVYYFYQHVTIMVTNMDINGKSVYN